VFVQGSDTPAHKLPAGEVKINPLLAVASSAINLPIACGDGLR
jgi:hypothetical protein